MNGASSSKLTNVSGSSSTFDMIIGKSSSHWGALLVETVLMRVCRRWLIGLDEHCIVYPSFQQAIPNSLTWWGCSGSGSSKWYYEDDNGNGAYVCQKANHDKTLPNGSLPNGRPEGICNWVVVYQTCRGTMIDRYCTSNATLIGLAMGASNKCCLWRLRFAWKIAVQAIYQQEPSDRLFFRPSSPSHAFS